MRSLRKILAFLFLVMAGLMIAGLALPGEWTVERTIDLAAEPATVFPLVEDLGNWPEWMISFEHDPEMETHFSDPSLGVGASFAWSGNSAVGRGRWEVSGVRPGESVGLCLDMEDGDFVAAGAIEVLPESGGTRVTWRLGGALGNDPFARLNRTLLQNAVGGTLQANLEKLKRLTEAR